MHSRRRAGRKRSRPRPKKTAVVEAAGETTTEQDEHPERLRTDAFENPGCILIADDDDALRDTLAELLERDLHTVIQAADGKACLDLAQARHPDLILLDIRMPIMDGFTVCQQLKADAHLHYVPVLVLTAAADAESQMRALECGANDFLAKPVSGLVLSTRVRALLKYRRALQALERHQTELEERVIARTAELTRASRELLAESDRRQKVQAALEHERALLRTVIDTLPDAVFLKDTEGRFLLVNQRVVKDVGARSAEDLLGKTDFDFYPHVDAVRFQASEREVMRTGQAILGRENTYVYADGRTVHTVTTKLPMRDPDGRITGILGVHSNITQRKEAEKALASERATLRAMLDNLPDVVFLKDTASRFMAANKNVLTDLRVDHMDKVLGKTDHDFFPPADAERFFREEQEILRTGRPILNREATHRTEDGKEHAYVSTKLPLRDASGRIVGLLGINRDISENRRLEQQLRHAQKMEAIGQLAGGIAHDFNNMLMVILGYAECLQMDQKTPPSVREQIDSIHHAAQRAARLTRQLLSFSRRQVLQPKQVDLNSVLADMEQMLQRLIGEHIALQVQADPNLPRVRADAGQLEQVVMNLILNARDAMPDGGRLTIVTSDLKLTAETGPVYGDVPPGHYALLTVTDSGQGMSPETQARLFEPFFTTKPFGKGTGLGLSVVYGVIRQSGGHIHFTSVPGRGTTFNILLPAVAPRSRAEPTATPAKPDGGTETILLVEDEDQVRGLARTFLTSFGYRVMEESDPSIALKRVRFLAEPIHLLITDVLMPGMNGTQLAQQLKQTHPGLKVLYISGYPAEAATAHGVLDGEEHFLQKPFSAADLSRKVRALLDLPSAARSS